MTTYYIKKYGEHELHQSNCVWLPIRKGMVKLGKYNTTEEALEKARTLYEDVNLCLACCSITERDGAGAVES